MALMEEMNHEHGQTFFIVTHDAGVGRRCDRLVTMRDGEIASEERY